MLHRSTLRNGKTAQWHLHATDMEKPGLAAFLSGAE